MTPESTMQTTDESAVSIVIPAFNEEKTIATVVQDIYQFITKKQIKAEIIVVNDGSKDGTKAVLQNIPFITYLEHRLNRGYGASLKTGISNASYPWILTIDADGSHPASQIDHLLPYRNDYDLIVGARDGKLGYDTFFRRLGRTIITAFAEYICKESIADINSGFRLFRKDLAKKFWHLYPEGFSFSTTITVGAHVRKHPVKYLFTEVHKRKGGTSTIKPVKDFIGFLNIVMRLAIYFRPLSIFVPLALSLIALGFIVVGANYFLYGGILKTAFAVLVMTGIQMATFGLIAEMIVKRFYTD
jgi:glycosyltransferase involved in cell wall biosynthesis